jgi:hypothetical protein
VTAKECEAQPVVEQGRAVADRRPILALLGANAVSQIGNVMAIMAVPPGSS